MAPAHWHSSQSQYVWLYTTTCADFTDKDDDGKIVHDIIPNDIPSDIETHENVPLPTLQDNELDSNVENELHLESGSEFLQQRDNVELTDPAPESRYNLRQRNRLNPYTFSGKVSEKWLEAPRRSMKCPFANSR